MTPEETRARLLYRDGLMLVIDKPAGIAVHKGPKGGASLEDDFDALRFGLPRRPALAHRLDRETAGCLVLGRHHKALEKLGLLFKQGEIEKTYWAIVEGGPRAEQGLIDLPLGRLDATRGWWMKVDPNGAAGANALDGAGRGADRRAPDRLARPRAADRAHPSIARALRRQGLADRRRRRLWERARRAVAIGARPAIAGAARWRADRQVPPAGGRRSAGAAAYAGRADRLRLCRRSAAPGPVADGRRASATGRGGRAPPAYFGVNDSSLNGDVSIGDNLGSFMTMKPKPADS